MGVERWDGVEKGDRINGRLEKGIGFPSGEEAAVVEEYSWPWMEAPAWRNIVKESDEGAPPGIGAGVEGSRRQLYRGVGEGVAAGK